MAVQQRAFPEIEGPDFVKSDEVAQVADDVVRAHGGIGGVGRLHSIAEAIREGELKTLRDLEREIDAVGGEDLVIGVVADPSQFSIAGTLKGNAKMHHPGAEVSFESGGRRLVFHTDAFDYLASNLRAIALGLEALRAVDRYGITSTREQYAGFAAIIAGGPDPARGAMLVERAGGITEALKRHHPDHQGDPRDFADVQAFRKSQAAVAR
jgi:hypothetical protein